MKTLVLIIEDEEIIRAMAVFHLRNLGFRTLEADNLKDARKAFSERSEELVAVIWDRNILDGNTDTLLEEMVVIFPGILHIGISGSHPKEQTELGCSRVLQKPFPWASFVDIFKGLLKKEVAA